MVILLLDVRDDFVQGVSDSFVAGYFDPLDQTGGANNQDIIYLDVAPAHLSGTGARDVYSTLAHEYQHLIHFGRDKQEHEWVNEGLSELSPVLMGLPHRSFSHYLANTNAGLTDFNGSLADYARLSLFFLYSWVQLGTPFIRDLIANSGVSTAGFSAALASHTSLSLVDLVDNWHLANFIHGSGELGYGEGWAIPDPLMQRSLYRFPATMSATISPYAAHWTLISHGSNLTLTGSATANAKVTLFKGADRTPLDGASILAGGFTDPDYGSSYTDLLVLTSAGTLPSLYSLNINAEGIFDEVTISYDNNQTIFQQQFIGLGDRQAVVEFNIPSVSIDLTSVSLLTFSSNPVVMRLYAGPINPATLFFTDTIPASYQLQWAPHRLPPGLDMGGKTLFVGLTGVALGYNEAQQRQWSYLGDVAGENFAPLDSFSVGDGPLVGNWSVRVSYLKPGVADTSTAPELIVGVFYANPFIHDGTFASVVRIDVDHEDAVDLRIYNLLGQQVWKGVRPAGDSAPLAWRGITNDGRSLPSGVYVGVIRVGAVIQKRKLVLIR
ncbi:MAG: T9SS type A sorting domain-containing protein [Candidatus Marinimicrobia bacterium]|nr:T9SS type A sorting domain-containing protein [Candidatus Neomarinimicrobiota bacterium]